MAKGKGKDEKGVGAEPGEERKGASRLVQKGER